MFARLLNWLRRGARESDIGETASEAEMGVDTRAEPLPWASTKPLPMPLPLPMQAAPPTLPPGDTLPPPDESDLRHQAALQARGMTALDYVAETAARICDTPVAAVTVLDGQTIWFQATVGLQVESLPQGQTFSAHVLRERLPLLLVPDALQDTRFASLPLVVGEPHLRFYAGAPFFSETGLALGTVSVADTEPRELTPVQQRTLELLARQTAMLLHARAQSGEEDEASGA